MPMTLDSIGKVECMAKKDSIGADNLKVSKMKEMIRKIKTRPHLL
jgi:hypothetical protein